MRDRLRVCLRARFGIAMLVALALGFVCTFEFAGIVGASPAEYQKTVVKVVSPVDAHGDLAQGYIVSKVLSGSCFTGSYQADVYRCITKSEDDEPCWPLPMEKAHAVVCLNPAWSTQVLEIKVRSLPKLPPGPSRGSTEVTQPLALPDQPTWEVPWAVQLSTGQRCAITDGAPDTFRGVAARYYCSPSDLELLNYANPSTPRWSFASVTVHGTRLMAGPTVYVSIAWFANP
jgi:hypothetical protein